MRHLALLLLIAGFTSTAWGRISIGNGGHVIECTKPDGTVTREVYDLWEGRALYGYDYPTIDTDPAEVAREWAKRIDDVQGSIKGVSTDHDSIADKLEYVIARMRLLPQGVTLKPTGDTLEFIELPSNCRFRQGVNFRDSNHLYADREIWEGFASSPLDRAALYLHEAVYWFLRERGAEEDSRRTRKAVAYIASMRDLRARDELPVGVNRVYVCQSRERGSGGDWTTKFLAYKHGDQVTLQFLQLGGYRMLARATLSAPAGGQPFPLPSPIGEVRTIEGLLDSPIDFDARVRVRWDRHNMTVEGELQPFNSVSDRIFCSEQSISSL